MTVSAKKSVIIVESYWINSYFGTKHQYDATLILA